MRDSEIEKQRKFPFPSVFPKKSKDRTPFSFSTPILRILLRSNPSRSQYILQGLLPDLEIKCRPGDIFHSSNGH